MTYEGFSNDRRRFVLASFSFGEAPMRPAPAALLSSGMLALLRNAVSLSHSDNM